MKPKLTFLLSLTFLFLFSSSVYGDKARDYTKGGGWFQRLTGSKMEYCDDRSFKGTIVEQHEDEDGNKKVEIHCRNGRRDGLFTQWYENGKKEIQGLYKDGKKSGLWTDWYKEGRKREDYRYKNGLRHGHYTVWGSDGIKFSEGQYRNGKRDGLYTTYGIGVVVSRGKKHSEQNYKNGKKEGRYRLWDNSGNIIVEEYFKEGRQLEYEEVRRMKDILGK